MFILLVSVRFAGETFADSGNHTFLFSELDSEILFILNLIIL